MEAFGQQQPTLSWSNRLLRMGVYVLGYLVPIATASALLGVLLMNRSQVLLAHVFVMAPLTLAGLYTVLLGSFLHSASHEAI